ncbi:MAG: hypothetical protein ACHQ7N_13935 [Candidatus Methylomirabilales bacterium]
MDQKLKTITITPDKISRWEEEADELRAKITENTRRLHVLTQRLDALPLFVEDRATTGDDGQVKSMDASKDALSLPPPQFIIHLVQSNPEPWMKISKLKEKIVSSGYPKEKFGPGYRYLYTLIPRLAKSGKIQKDGDRVSLKRTPVLPGVT